MRPVPLATPFGRLVRGRGDTRAVILSAAVHLGVVLALLWGGARFVEDSRAPGPGHGKGGGGGGGGGSPRTLVLYEPEPAPPPQPVPPPQQLVVRTVPVPAPVVKPPDSTPKPPAAAPAPAAGPAPGAGAGPGTGAGKGPGAGGGSGGGTGGGVGPGVGADSGGGGTVLNPYPQTVIMPPSHVPRELRGSTITAVFEIGADGKVEHVSLEPMPADRKFASDFLQTLRQYAFTAARTLDGRPVAAILRVHFTLP
jgi:hypothetical protein